MNFGDDVSAPLAPDAICVCGHPLDVHSDAFAGECCGDADKELDCMCSCKGFRAQPVRLADHGDHCSRCHRALNVTEPVFCGPAGGVYCAACHDATEGERQRFTTAAACTRCGAPAGQACDIGKHDARADQFNVDFAQAPTSVIMRAAAVAFEAFAPMFNAWRDSRGAESCVRFAAVLRERAERLRAAVPATRNPLHQEAAERARISFELLAKIGEVQS